MLGPAEQDDVTVMWYARDAEGLQCVELVAAGNMKRPWVNYRGSRNRYTVRSEGQEFLRKATQVKDIWILYVE